MGRRAGVVALLSLAGGVLIAGGSLLACEFLYSVPLEGSGEGGAPDGAADVASGDARADTATHETGARDAVATDRGAPSDAEGDVHVTPTVYNVVGDTANWTTFDTVGLNTDALEFAGGTFDGRYVYLGPNELSLAVRYDTQASFTAQSSWGQFDTTPLLDGGPPPPDAGPPSPYAKYEGCVFDGRYVYYVPLASPPPAIATRYDTSSSFTAKASWESFETSSLPGGRAYGFASGAFDGRYVYMVPGRTTTLARYDTHATTFGAAGWSTFDINAVSGSGEAGFSDVGFVGAVFDGQYLYLVPDEGTVVLRFDTTKPLVKASWSTFDFSVISGKTEGFSGGAFDGRYVYLAPGYNSIVIRYDTTQAFSETMAWSSFATSAVNSSAGGFFGAAFDGQNVYFVPYLTPEGFRPSGFVVTYDITGDFFDPGAWSTFDTETLADHAGGFNGAVFDGQYLYLVPDYSASHGVVARFNAKSPPSLPALPAFHGSFF